MTRQGEPFRTILVLKLIGTGVLVLAVTGCLIYVLATGH